MSCWLFFFTQANYLVMLCRLTSLNWTSKTSIPSFTEILIREPPLLCPGCQVSPAHEQFVQRLGDLHWQTFIYQFFHLPRHRFVFLGVYDVKLRLDDLMIAKGAPLRQACWGAGAKGRGVDELNPMMIQLTVTSHFSTLLVGFLCYQRVNHQAPVLFSCKMHSPVTYEHGVASSHTKAI